jgi:esterase/lipase
MLLTMNLNRLISKPKPLNQYPEAIDRIKALQALEDESILPKSKSQLFTHGYKTRRVIVWFHGYTNSPAQFEQLGQLCFDQGDNVYIPRTPYHGLKDRLTLLTGKLTAEILIEFADSTIDIAGGLGESIIVGGLSMGGVITAWLAQQRQDVARAVVISPAFGTKTIPTSMIRPITEALLIVPNTFRWWDPDSMDFTSEPLHAYPRYSTRGLAQIFRLGFAVQTMARLGEPNAGSIWMVTNANDSSVNNEIADQICQYWRENASQSVHAYTFGANLNLGHDLIDPLQPNQKVDLVYPVLLDIMK